MSLQTIPNGECMRTQELIEACHELAVEAFEWTRLQKEAQARGEYIEPEELHKLTAKGAWDKYLNAYGDRGMINRELSEEEDFGGQYDKMCKEAGFQ